MSLHRFTFLHRGGVIIFSRAGEEHIEQATNNCRRNKFLMLTGASGDGKSSLVYAGIVPNARAGFLKIQVHAMECGRFPCLNELPLRTYAVHLPNNWELPMMEYCRVGIATWIFSVSRSYTKTPNALSM